MIWDVFPCWSRFTLLSYSGFHASRMETNMPLSAPATAEQNAAIVMFAAALPLDDLAGDYESMGRVATIPWLIGAGVLSATLSSALASICWAQATPLRADIRGATGCCSGR